jgi:ABC-2 type transport system ATP-binding protein
VDPWLDGVALHRRLAYVPGDVTLWPKPSGGEANDVLAQLGGDLDRRCREELIGRFELDPTKKARTLKGNRQKVGLVAAMASSADCRSSTSRLPASTPLMRAVFQDCVRGLEAEGRTVLLSSHVLAEAETLCDRVIIIRAGQTHQSGTLREPQGKTRTSIMAEQARSANGLGDLPGIRGFQIDGDRVRFQADTVRLDDEVRPLSELAVESLMCQPPTLEALFLRHDGDELAGEPELVDFFHDGNP